MPITKINNSPLGNIVISKKVFDDDKYAEKISEVVGKTLTATLSAGSTSVTFTDSAITTTATIDFYTSVFGVNPTAVEVSSGSLTMTFKAQNQNVGVKVVIR